MKVVESIPEDKEIIVERGEIGNNEYYVEKWNNRFYLYINNEEFDSEDNEKRLWETIDVLKEYERIRK